MGPGQFRRKDISQSIFVKSRLFNPNDVRYDGAYKDSPKRERIMKKDTTFREWEANNSGGYVPNDVRYGNMYKDRNPQEEDTGKERTGSEIEKSKKGVFPWSDAKSCVKCPGRLSMCTEIEWATWNFFFMKLYQPLVPQCRGPPSRC